MRLPALLHLPRAFAALAAVWIGAASASTSGIVISQVYGGNGTTYNRDYVELFNAGNAPVTMTNWSIQYSSATGTGLFSSNGISTINATLQPGQYHLVGLSTAATGLALPAVDTSGSSSTNLSSGSGKVVLASVNTGLACNGAVAGTNVVVCTPAQLAQIVDAVGYGTANFSETAAAPALTTSTALFRAVNGCTDSGSNAADFSTGTPAPRSSASPLAPCGGNQAIVPSCPATANVAVGTPIGLALSATDPDDAVSAVKLPQRQCRRHVARRLPGLPHCRFGRHGDTEPLRRGGRGHVPGRGAVCQCGAAVRELHGGRDRLERRWQLHTDPDTAGQRRHQPVRRPGRGDARRGDQGEQQRLLPARRRRRRQRPPRPTACSSSPTVRRP